MCDKALTFQTEEMTNAESLGQGCVGTYQGQKEGILEVRAIGANSGKHLEFGFYCNNYGKSLEGFPSVLTLLR